MNRATDDDLLGPYDRVHQMTNDDRRRERRRAVTWTLLVLLCLVAIMWAASAGEPPEVTLEPVTVEMSDPIPCADDPEVRQLYVELGVLCRGDR